MAGLTVDRVATPGVPTPAETTPIPAMTVAVSATRRDEDERALAGLAAAAVAIRECACGVVVWLVELMDGWVMVL